MTLERVVTIETGREGLDAEALATALDEMLRDLGAEFADRFPGVTLTVRSIADRARLSLLRSGSVVVDRLDPRQ